MKHYLNIMSVYLPLLCTISICSCVQEEVFLSNGDLNIKTHVPKTRSTLDQPWDQDCNAFNYGENECCLVALVELKQQQMENHTFTNDNTATEFYEAVNNYARSLTNDNGESRYNGGMMDLEVFLEVGQHYGLIERRVYFSSDEEKRLYFSNPENNPIAILISVINKKTGSNEPHVATIISVNNKKETVTYSSKEAIWNKETINASEVLSVWE